MIKTGDRVNHVYDMRLVGTVVQLIERAGTEHLRVAHPHESFSPLFVSIVPRVTVRASLQMLMT